MNQPKKSHETSKKRKNINIREQYEEKTLYVKYRTLPQELARGIRKFSNHFSEKKNITAMQVNMLNLTNDLHQLACTIKSSKKAGLGATLMGLLLPTTFKSVYGEKNEGESDSNTNQVKPD